MWTTKIGDTMENVPNFECNVNDEDETIERCVHDASHSYSIISNDLIRNTTLSMECTAVLIYLLSHKQGWRITTKSLMLHLKGRMGRDKIRKVMNEAIAAGYMKRDKMTLHRGEKGRVTRTVCRYTVSERPKFKSPDAPLDKNTHAPTSVLGQKTEIQSAGIQCAGDTGSLKNIIEERSTIRERREEKEQKKESAIADVSSKDDVVILTKSNTHLLKKASDISKEMIECMKQVKPDCRIPKNLTAMDTHVDFMIRLDNRSREQILDVFRFALSDDFWSDKMFKPNPAKYLRDKFDQLSANMHRKPQKKERRFAPSSNDAEAHKKMEEMDKHAL